jgi:hypothetical protein
MQLPGLSRKVDEGNHIHKTVVYNGGQRAVFMEFPTYRFRTWDLVADKEIVMWDPYSGELNQSPMAVSADGKVFVVHGGRNTDPGIDAWDPETGRQLTHIRNVLIGPTGLCISHDGRLVAAYQPDKGLGVWTLPEGREVCRPRLEGGGGWSSLLAFSPDGKTLAALIPPTSVHAWEVPSGKKIMACTARLNGVSVMNFSPQGDRLVAAGGGYGGVLMQVPSKESSAPGSRQLRAIYGAAFLKQGAEVLLATREVAEITSVATGKTLRQVPVSLPNMQIVYADFAADGRSALLRCAESKGKVNAFVWRLPE